MGSFNQVCMLSGLPITYQDPVRAVLVTEHPRATLGTATCDYSSKYLPRTFPIRGTYDDYGRLENVPDDIFKRLWVKGLQRELIELRVGENPCHDIAVSRDMDFDQLWEAIWEERLLVPGYGLDGPRKSNGPVPLEEVDLPASRGTIRNVRVQVAMIREDVWKAIMASPFEPSPFYKLPRTFDELRWGVRGYWDECQTLLREESSDPSALRELFPARMIIRSSRHLPSMQNPLNQVIQDECVSGLGTHWLMALEGEAKPEDLDGLYLGVTEMIWFIWVNSYRSRGSLWKPSYAGGQDNPWEEHLRFHQDMAAILEGLVAKHKEEYGDEP